MAHGHLGLCTVLVREVDGGVGVQLNHTNLPALHRWPRVRRLKSCFWFYAPLNHPHYFCVCPGGRGAGV